jgi:hypothetical protein
MDHKGSISHLDFLSKSQQVISCEMAAHAQQQNPIEINLTTSTWFFLEIGQRFRAKSVSAINSTPQYPLGLRTSRAPTME